MIFNKQLFLSATIILCTAIPNIHPFLKQEKNIQSQVKNKKAIVVGATSGMGRQVAKILAQEGYEVGLAGRRLSLLQSLQQEIPTKTYLKQLDVTNSNATQQLENFIAEIGGLDLIVISISAANDNDTNPDKELENKIRTLEVDLFGFWKIADTAIAYFLKQGYGHLAGISSTSGLRGEAKHPVYSGAKAFISRYLEGIRNSMIQQNIPIHVTDLIPGWVEIESCDIHTYPGAYWVATTEDAARQICDAIKNKDKKAYITKRWALIALLYDITPDWIYNAIGGF